MGHLPGPPRRHLMADAPLKPTDAGKSCLLPATSGEILCVLWVHGFAGAGIVPKEFDSFFLREWDGLEKTEGGQRSTPTWRGPVPPLPSWETKILGFGEGGISLLGHIWIFADYRLL